MLAFSARDDSFHANLETNATAAAAAQATPTMCPTFLVTGEEIMSTRGAPAKRHPRGIGVARY